ncbi:MAG: thiamine pyrophosphate-binding protein [Candidatus Tectomicrobia bacterium]|nr:thiamine pyrophosphate-binding protein [Candidatus Tectomicrobia bacterium]
MAEMTGGEALIATVKAAGVEYLFGLPGSTCMHILDAVVQEPSLKFILALHEGSLVSMADGYARASGKPAFVNIHALPGTANSIGPLFDAYRDRSPLVVVAGQQDQRVLGRDSHTEAQDLTELPRQFTKWSWEVPRADRIPEALARAFKVATTPPTGPVYLSIPSDMLEARQEYTIPDMTRYRVSSRIPGDAAQLAKAAQLLLEAKRPFIVAGSGVQTEDGVDELVELAELLGAPVVSEPWNSFLGFEPEHPLFFGEFALDAAYDGPPDLVLGVACRMFLEFSYTARAKLPPAARAIHLNVDAWEIGKIYPVQVGVVADAKSALSALVRIVKSTMTEAQRGACAARHGQVERACREQRARRAVEQQAEPDAVPIRPWRLVHALNEVLGDDVVIVREAPTTKFHLMTYFQFKRRDSFFGQSSGHLGWGFPASLGVQLARPERPVVAFVGDGCFMFNLQGLWTMARYQLPVLVIVCNNQTYMSVKYSLHFRAKGKASQTGEYHGVDFGVPRIDYVTVAAGFGIHAERVEDPGELAATVKRLVDLRRPALLDVVIDPKDTGTYRPRLP